MKTRTLRIVEYIRYSIWGAIFISLFILVVFRIINHFVGQVEVTWIKALLSAIPVLGTGIILWVFSDRYNLFSERTGWVVVMYVWLMAMFPQTYAEWEAAISALFIAAALLKMAASINEPASRSHFFLGGFFITCAGLLFRPAFFLNIPLVFGFLFMAEVSVKNILAYLGGVVAPLLLLFSGLWFVGVDTGGYVNKAFAELTSWNPSFGFKTSSYLQLIALLVMGALLLFSLIIRLIRRESTTTLCISRFYIVMFCLLVFSGALLIFYPHYVNGFLAHFMIPVTFFITSMFTEKRLFGARIWVALFVLSSFVYYFPL